MIYWYLIVVNIIGFVLMGADKRKARRQEWRISEKTLWITIFIGGSIGSYLGMKQFHHKTKHTSFKMGVPLVIVLQAALFIFLLVS
jgi:uncharacterized membrane protein YsdA (DUF1294 family)